MARIRVITLLTDFGTSDPYLGAMKGALLRSCPGVAIVDISNDQPSHDILAASFVLGNAAPFFPADTLHVVVIDPQVGTDRRLLVGRFGGQLFLFPDNGVITYVARVMPMEDIVSVRNPRYMLTVAPSMTFHGRDVFAPLAGVIASGIDIHQLGPQPDSYKLLDIPEPVLGGGAIQGQVMYVDKFGNLITNIPMGMMAEHLGEIDRLTVRIGDSELGAPVGTYGFARSGEALSLINSMSLLEIAVNCGRACDVLKAGIGEKVYVTANALTSK